MLSEKSFIKKKMWILDKNCNKMKIEHILMATNATGEEYEVEQKEVFKSLHLRSWTFQLESFFPYHPCQHE